MKQKKILEKKPTFCISNHEHYVEGKKKNKTILNML